MKPRLLITHSPDMLRNYYGARALAALRELADVQINTRGEVLDAAALIQAAQGCQIIVADRQTAGPAEVFDKLPELVAFLRVAVDIRNIDVPAASRAGVLVTQATPGFIASVAEMAIGYMVNLARGVTASTLAYREGREPEPMMGRQLKGAVLGIIGYGVIGRYLARLALAFEMVVIISDPFQKAEGPNLRNVGLDEVLASSDFVVCLAVANAETENLMNADAFSKMQPSAYFINLSRGNLVDEAALEAALIARQIAGAAMDVGRAPDQKPSLHLASRTDVVATPHTAGLTPQAVEHQAFDTVEQVRALVSGKIPPGAVNTDQASRLASFFGRIKA